MGTAHQPTSSDTATVPYYFDNPKLVNPGLILRRTALEAGIGADNECRRGFIGLSSVNSIKIRPANPTEISCVRRSKGNWNFWAGASCSLMGIRPQVSMTACVIPQLLALFDFFNQAPLKKKRARFHLGRNHCPFKKKAVGD